MGRIHYPHRHVPRGFGGGVLAGRMTQFWLVRHGQTDWNVEGRWQGQVESAPPLNAAGQAQAEALAAQLNGARFEAIYSSDALRARETAGILAARLRLTVKVDPRLREIHQGEWEGMLGRDIADRYPAAWAARERDPLHARPPGGESVAEVAARLWRAADDILRVHPVGQLLIVSHGLALATLICRARGLPLTQAYQVVPDNAHPEVIEWTLP